MSRSKPWNRSASRRGFLGSLGAAGVTAALVPLLESESEAGGESPKRLLLLTSANGTIHEQWKPSHDGESLQLSNILAPLEAHKDDLVVLDGLGWQYGDGPGTDHMRICMLWNGTQMLQGSDFQDSNGGNQCGWGGGVSVDQFLAQRLAGQTPFDSLEFGAQNGGFSHLYTRVTYAGPNQPIPAEDNPYAMFERLFSEFSQDAAELAALRSRRKSVIDAVKGSLSSLETRVAASDRIKLEAHLDAVRSIEKRLDTSTGCDVPLLGEKIDVEANDNFPAISRLQIDMMVLAMACDLTRISSLLWARAGSFVRYSWLGQKDGHHTIAHEADAVSRNQIADINTWHAGELAYLLDALKAVPEGDGTMLDNTLVVWGNELADGDSHAQNPLPLVLAGGAGGQLKTGRLLEYDNARHNGLLVSICNLMGQADVSSFGDLDDGSGPLDGLIV